MQDMRFAMLFTLLVAGLLPGALHFVAERHADVLPPRLFEISNFTSSFHEGQESRNHNIRLAAFILNGKEIAAGQTFSFNGTIGRRSGRAGFLRAPYLEFGERIEVEGGGICLVSSVLYNAALLAGMEILERYPHSSIVPYLPPGQDATVDYGHKDLRFRNIYAEKIQITTEISGSRLIIRLWGQSFPLRKIGLESINKTLPDGRLQVSTFRNVYLDGRLIQTNLLSEDTYPPEANRVARQRRALYRGRRQ